MTLTVVLVHLNDANRIREDWWLTWFIIVSIFLTLTFNGLGCNKSMDSLRDLPLVIHLTSSRLLEA